MFNRPKPVEIPGLTDAINQVFEELKTTEPGTAEFESLITQLERLYKLKIPVAEPKSVSPDALIAAGTNIGGILAILTFEHFAVVTSKALGFVTKIRL